MTEFNTIIENAPGKDTVYTIKFTTNNKKHFERLQEEARKCVDGDALKPTRNVAVMMFREKKTALRILKHLMQIIDDYGEASVADYYDLFISSSIFDPLCFNDICTKYGWVSASKFQIVKVNNHYDIIAPTAIRID